MLKWPYVTRPASLWSRLRTTTKPKIYKRWYSDEVAVPPKYTDIPKGPTVFDCSPDTSERGLYTVSTCDPALSWQQPRVVIIGAGMAGLSAAARLAEQGITNFIVLEASERPGGRICSCWLGDVVAELGASWYPDESQAHPLYKLAAEGYPPRPGVPGVEHPRDLLHRVVCCHKMPFPPMCKAYHIFRQIEQEAGQIYCLGASKQHGSILNFISMRIQQEVRGFPEWQQHDMARVLFGLTHMVFARGSTDTGLLWCDNECTFMNLPGADVRVPLGLVGTLAPLFCQIPEGTLHYCNCVNTIYWGTSQKSGHRAVVVTASGKEISADYVIITIPLGVMQRYYQRMFCPPLPAAKVDAMRCIGFGACNKIFLEYCRPFWYWHNGFLNFQFSPAELNSRHDWTKGITSVEVVPHSKQVLCMWMTGPCATEMEHLADYDVAEGCTKVLRAATKNASIPYPATVMRSRWSLNMNYHGAYSFTDSVGGQPQAALACPLPAPGEPVPPILLFAGEATVPGLHGTTAAARISGLREADRVVDLTERHRGPPLPDIELCREKRA